MYTGDPVRGDRGYLIYNTHNQFLETILQTGIIGLSVFLIICFSLVKMAVLKKNRMTSFTILLLLAWLFTESVLETQYGIIIFTFFPLFVADGKIEKPTL
jgi:O-antigen ligase